MQTKKEKKSYFFYFEAKIKIKKLFPAGFPCFLTVLWKNTFDMFFLWCILCFKYIAKGE